MKIGSKFIFGIVIIATLAVISTAGVIGVVSLNKTENVVREARQDQMISLRNVAQKIVNQYYNSLENQILSASQQQIVREAIRNLSSSYKPFPFFVGRKDRDGQRQNLKNYYISAIATKYDALNPGKSLDVNKLIGDMSHATLALQDQYIAKNKNDIYDKDKMVAASDRTSYTSGHKQYHPYFRAFLTRFNLQDILLINSKTGDVVYSVKKNIDFAASVTKGVFKDSGLARAFKQANQLKDNHYAFTDYKPYLAALGMPTGFISAPVFEKGKRVGVVVFALSSEKLTKLVTYDYQWKKSGLGLTGETYLVSSDQTPRSTSRLLLEHPAEYLSLAAKLNYPQQIIDTIKAKKTDVAIYPIHSDAIKTALSGLSGTLVNNNYLKQRVLTAFAPLDIMGHKWAILNEIHMNEVLSRITEIRSFILFMASATAIVIIALGAFAGFFITKSIVRPIKETSHSLIDIAQGEGDLTSRLNDTRKDELGELASGFNQFVGKIHLLVQNIKTSVASLSNTVVDMNQIATEGRTTVNDQNKETEMIVTAINQISASAQEVAGNASNAAQIAHDADAEGKHVQSIVNKAITSIENLSEEIGGAANVIDNLKNKVTDIVAILDVIRGIADQTNVLALNAAIESARAGEHGRGFAVVADEVRALSKKTQDSTAEIQEMIEALQSDSLNAFQVMSSSRSNSKKSSEITRDAGKSLLKIADAISSINDMNAQIASAADEQKVAIEEINRSMVSISQSGDKTLNGVTAIARNSKELTTLSESLEEKVRQFKV
ncbi:MAG: hypothetical protein CENE_02273 [Candidatus Celerinatantimonas neptuna]|nr:MAG: hypothetical protein CENE_02273 [Candidatus Celerinatantimonas neptuna]